MTAVALTDADLVGACLSGNRDAFTQIVSRYQSLICSLAYSATGSLGQSEDLAQETFITAWKHLRRLRERHKLKAWLCGIARNRINSFLRRDNREPLHLAEPLEEIHDSVATGPLPHDQTISKEEEAILWRSLERIPEQYRETLVLFYREHQSIENVAAALDLSEDAVKQRLSRGRKLLASEVAAFVEGALERSNPTKTFTLAVLASLPVLTTSAKAATLGAIAAQGSATAKFAAGAGFLNAAVGLMLGFAGPWLQYRIALESAMTDVERAGVRRYFRCFLSIIASFAAALLALTFFGRTLVKTHPVAFVSLLIGLLGFYVLVGVWFALWSKRMFRLHRQDVATRGEATRMKPFWEYRSAQTFLGLPLVHVRLGRPVEQWSPVKAWFAAGDCAFGGLFAFGGLAFAPISVGGLAIGLIPWGGAALGALALGGVALGGCAFGGLALGWQAFGGCAVGWSAAVGGIAIAHDFALGGAAYALQFNNELAERFIKSLPFFVGMNSVARYIVWANLLWLIPLVAWWRAVKRANPRHAVEQF